MLGRMAAKRLLDLVCATLLLLLLTPVLVVVLGAMAFDLLLVRRDRGGLLYREERISRGRAFDLLKFRTLRRDVVEKVRFEESHARLYEADPDNLTWAGRRVLKPWYLDELPQLLNVLRGDISLVGPRPWPREMVQRQVAAGLTYRNEIAAGLTGPAQVTKGSSLRFAEIDLGYVERLRSFRGLGLVRYDLRILWATVRVIVRGEGLSN
jgi:lipopolysaccharide/colanic/teichoic acid biosynthesis glycosyltransferase